MASASELVKKQLESYCRSLEWNKKRKKNLEYAKAIEKICVNDIDFRQQPIIKKGYIKGNVTAEGERDLDGIKYVKTINLNFTTKEKEFVMKGFESIGYAQNFGLCRLYCGDPEKVAKKEGKELCDKTLSNINFYMKPFSYRLNNWSVVFTTDEIKIPVWPIYAKINYENHALWTKIGYYVKAHNEVYIKLNINVPMTSKKENAIVISIIIYVVIIIIIIIILKIVGF